MAAAAEDPPAGVPQPPVAATPAESAVPAPAATSAAATPGSGNSAADPPGKADQLKIIGGLLALVAGLIALLGVLGLAIAVRVTEMHFSQLAATVIGVIGSIVGAYFGVKIGSDGTDKALEAQRQESARAQIFAAHLPPAEAAQALQLAFPALGPAVAKPDGAGAPDPAPPAAPDPAPPADAGPAQPLPPDAAAPG
jgi:hypothetical protein